MFFNFFSFTSSDWSVNGHDVENCNWIIFTTTKIIRLHFLQTQKTNSFRKIDPTKRWTQQAFAKSIFATVYFLFSLLQIFHSIYPQLYYYCILMKIENQKNFAVFINQSRISICSLVGLSIYSLVNIKYSNLAVVHLNVEMSHIRFDMSPHSILFISIRFIIR